MTDTERDQEALREKIEQNEAQLKQALGTLKHSIKNEVQVGPRVAKYTYRALAIALAVGFVAGVLPHSPALPLTSD